jgi:hypothetical protein
MPFTVADAYPALLSGTNNNRIWQNHNKTVLASRRKNVIQKHFEPGGLSKYNSPIAGDRFEWVYHELGYRSRRALMLGRHDKKREVYEKKWVFGLITGKLS